MRKIPSDGSTLILPARLKDVSGFLPTPPDRTLVMDLPEWFPQERFATICDWERRRWSMVGNDKAVEVGLWKLAWHVDRVMNDLRPAVVLTSNKIDHGTALFDWAGRHMGCDTRFVERSATCSFFIEPKGMFAESVIWADYPAEAAAQDDEYLRVGTELSEALRENPEGFRKQKAPRSLSERALADLPRPHIFLPMDNVLWTGWGQAGHWQGTVDTYADTPAPAEAVARLASIARELGGTLIVKRHPADLERYPVHESGVVEIDAPIDLLISDCDVCVSFLTKLAFVSLAFGKPTVVLGPNPVVASGATYHTEHTADWAGVVRSALGRTSEERRAHMDAYRRFLAWLDLEFFISPDLPAPLGRPTVEDAVLKLVNRFPSNEAIGSSINMMQLTQRFVGALSDRRRWRTISADTQDAPLTVLIDVSRLTNTRLFHSGISRYIFALLKELDGREDVVVRPVITSQEILKRGEFDGNLSAFEEFLGKKVLLIDQIASLPCLDRAIYFSPYDPLPPTDAMPHIPRFITIHDVLHLTQSEFYLGEKDSDQIRRIIDSVHPADRILCPSEYTRMQLLCTISHPLERVLTTPLAAADAFHVRSNDEQKALREELNLGDDPYAVVFLQNDPRKNVRCILTALHGLLRDDTFGARILIVTSALRTSELPPEFEGHERVTVLEGPTDEKLAIAYSGALVMLYVSRGEGFGLPLLEAMRCGCPVVTSSVTSIPEVTGDGALYVDARNPDQIADAVRSISSSSSLHTSLAQSALSQSKKFSWARTTAEFIDEGRRALLDSATSIGAEDLVRRLDGIEVVQRQIEWRQSELTRKPTKRMFLLGDRAEPTLEAWETSKEAVHSFSASVATTWRDIAAAAILRPIERRYVGLWITFFQDKKKIGRAEVYIDLLEGRAVRTRTEDGVETISCELEALGNNWIGAVLRATCPAGKVTRVNIDVISRNTELGSSRHVGEGVCSFEIADSIVVGIPPAAATGADSDEDQKGDKGVEWGRSSL